MRNSSKTIVGSLLVIVVGIGVGMVALRHRTPAPAPAAAPAAEIEKPAPIPVPEPPPPQVVDASAPPAPPAMNKKAVKPKLLTESELMERLRKAQDTDEYMLSYDLAREGLRRFPKSPDAPEMAAMVVKSLARQGKISEARAEAEVMVNKYAGTFWAREVERHTGAHPIRNQVPPK
jgi:hypothetical protein